MVPPRRSPGPGGGVGGARARNRHNDRQFRARLKDIRRHAFVTHESWGSELKRIRFDRGERQRKNYLTSNLLFFPFFFIIRCNFRFALVIPNGWLLRRKVAGYHVARKVCLFSGKFPLTENPFIRINGSTAVRVCDIPEIPVSRMDFISVVNISITRVWYPKVLTRITVVI